MSSFSANKSKRAKSTYGKKVEESKDKGKYIKLRFKRKKKKVKFEEFMHVKNLDKQKLQATKDSMIQMMK